MDNENAYLASTFLGIRLAVLFLYAVRISIIWGMIEPACVKINITMLIPNSKTFLDMNDQTTERKYQSRPLLASSRVAIIGHYYRA